MKQIVIFLLFSSTVFSQRDTIHLLDEVKLYGNFSQMLNAGYQVQVLSDSIINRQQQSLGNLLQDQANIYFKQYGNGMVSSISLRGSGASHTGVYWNGIAINSALNGQTDFNTFSANGYNQIEIRKGGGSILFGSGAVGGVINLRDQIVYNDAFHSKIHLGLASYNTNKGLWSTRYSNQKWFTKIVLEGNQSTNDYPYLGTDLKNENGEYKNYHLKTVVGYALNANNQLELFATYSDNDRNLSRTLTAPNESKLTNTECRILLNWKRFGQRYNASLKLAFLNEEYRFYMNKTKSNYSFGKSDRFIFKYDFKYFIGSQTSVHTGVENRYTTAKGSSLLNKHRNNFEIYALFQQQPIEQLWYNLSIRKGFSSVYVIPLVFAADLKYSISSKFDFKANYSTNYRLPTYNDLYWNPGGNSDLIAEDSTTGEIGIAYHDNHLVINLASYLTKSKNLIQWRPETSTFWKPVNVQDVTSYGLEMDAVLQRKFGKHRFKLQSQYAYSVSIDNELNTQLIYVPYHKANFAFTYLIHGFTVSFKEHYEGKVFITTSNTQTVAHHFLSNIALNKNLFHQKLTIGLLVNNLWNKSYQSVSYRPMPNRNFEININYKL